METGKFFDLTPCYDVDLKAYEEAFDFVYKYDNVRNIAVSGPYSSGKSSVIHSYMAKHREHAPMVISLVHFGKNSTEPEKNKNASTTISLGQQNEHVSRAKAERSYPMSISVDHSDGTDITANRDELNNKLEAEIINQLVQRTDPKKIHDSRFQRMERAKRRRFIRDIALLAFAALFVVAFIFRHQIADTISKIDLAIPLSSTFVAGLSTCILIGIGAYFLYRVFRFFYRKREIQRISLPGSFGVEVGSLHGSKNGESDSNFFDKYLSEILYLFRECGTQTFIFEDIDRFDEIEVFTQLRKINGLLNGSLPKSDKRIFRFFYLVKDSLFMENDRTKFFDFIIPVVPYVLTSNAYQFLTDRLNERFSRNPLASSTRYLRRMSGNLSDARLMKNIVNEFYLHYHNLSDNPELDSEKLFSMMIYKSLFPQDYELLTVGKGKVYAVLSQCKEKIVPEVIRKLDAQISELRKEKENSDQLYVDALAEIDREFLELSAEELGEMTSLGDPAKLDFYVAGRQQENALYMKKVRAVETSNGEYADQIQSQKHVWENRKRQADSRETKLREDKAKASKIYLSELLELVEDQEPFLRLIASTIHDGKFDPSKEVEKPISFEGNDRFLFDLLVNGDINEDYQNYMTYFHPGELTRRDIGFITRIHNRAGFLPDYYFDNPDIVDEYLSDHEPSLVAAFNYIYFRYLFTDNVRGDTEEEMTKKRNSRIGKRRSMINGIRTEKANAFAVEAIQKLENIQPFAEEVAWLDSGLLLDMMKDEKLSEDHVFLLALPVIVDESFMAAFWTYSLEDRKTIREWFNSYANLLNNSFTDTEQFVEALIEIDYSAPSLDVGSNQPLKERLYQEGLFDITQSNIEYSVVHYFDDKTPLQWGNAFTRLFEEEEQSLSKMLDSQRDQLMDFVLENALEITDDENVVKGVLNHSDISQESKVEYARRLGVPIVVLEGVPFELYDSLIEADKVVFSVANLELYFAQKGELDAVGVTLIKNGMNHYKDGSLELDQAATIKNVELLRAILERSEEMGEAAISFLAPLMDILSAEDLQNWEQVPDWALSELIDYDRLMFDRETFELILSRTPDKLQSFTAAHFAEAEDMILDRSLTIGDEALELLLRKGSLSFAQQEAIFENTSSRVSLLSAKPVEKIALHIVEQKRFKDNLEELLAYYPLATQAVQEKLFPLVTNRLQEISQGKLAVSKELMAKLFEGVEALHAEKLRIVIANLDNLNKSEVVDLATKAGYGTTISVLNGKNPTVERSAVRIELAEALIEKGWISSYKDEPASGEMTLYAKRKGNDPV